MSLEVTMQNSYQVQTCEIFFYWVTLNESFYFTQRLSINLTEGHFGRFKVTRKSAKEYLVHIFWKHWKHWKYWQFLLHTKIAWGCFILLSHDNLGKFKVIGRKFLNFLSDLYRFIDKYWKFRLNIKIAYDLGVFHEPRVNWRSSRSWLNKALFLSMPFLVQSSHAYL